MGAQRQQVLVSPERSLALTLSPDRADAPLLPDRITNGPDASTLLVYAKTEPTKGSKGITTFM